MTALVRGYSIMAVREARRARDRLREGDTKSALNRLCWAWRYLTLAERATTDDGADAAYRCLERAACVVDAVRAMFVHTWPARKSAAA